MATSENVNLAIAEALKKLDVTILGHSDTGKTMNHFDTTIASSLFSFLIENNMNRYIFNAFLRQGSLDVNKFPFQFKPFNATTIREITKESFIKKFECKGCQNLLLRPHIHELDYRKLYMITCVRCERVNQFGYFELVDDFEINRNDLLKFLERLHKINVVKKDLTYFCPQCKTDKKVNLSQIGIVCELCKNNYEIHSKYTFNDDFLKMSLEHCDGSWFEWYVYMLNHHIYDATDHNLCLQFKHDGQRINLELDVIALDKNNNLLVFECKDNFKKNTEFGDMSNLPRLSWLFDKIFLVGSNTIKKRHRDDIGTLFKDKLAFISGSELEIQYASTERVITLLSNGPTAQIIPLFSKLPKVKKHTIVRHFISEVSSSYSQESHLLRKLSELIIAEFTISEISKSEITKIQEIMKQCMINIENSRLISESISFIDGILMRFNHEVILEVFTINQLMSIGTPYLSENSLSGYKERKPFFYFYIRLLSATIFNANDLDNTVFQNFFSKFITMIEIYYSDYSRRHIMDIIDQYWGLLNKDNKDKFGMAVASIFEKGKMTDHIIIRLSNEIILKYPEFDTYVKKLICDSLSKFISDDNNRKEYVNLILKKLK